MWCDMMWFDVRKTHLAIAGSKEVKDLASRIWKRQENEIFLKASKGMQLCWHLLDFNPVKLILDFWTPELKNNKFVFF